MRGLSTLVTLFALSVPSVVLAGSSCIAFDANFNLLALGFNGKDYNAGTSDTWASGTPTDITAQGRPPFNGGSVKCYLAQFFNAIYVLGADTSKASDIYIYDAGAKTWSTQAVTAGGFDPTSFEAILDHDTNVFYAISKGNVWSLDMKELKAGGSGALAWVDGGAAAIPTTNYDPVMGIAQNHIYFFGVPNVPAGSAPIFVIHFAFWQPTPQQYGSFPASHGQATSFFLDSGVQQEIAFIPDDGSKTYIVNVETNTTQTVAGPATVDAKATYFASTNALLQLASSGAVSWMPYSASDANANSAAKWAPVQKLASLASSSGGGASSGGSSAGGTSGAQTSAGAKGSSTAKTGGSALGLVAAAMALL
ncbi:hypothetical protein B0H15DRAFT_936621 [Mycena belliarum]|uniref:Uncharacterized protein n=1 Tax=Mycena belliarum TaxID=1033014 RepID=A0AAD6XW96_9AGAR|nr:hypothetical protein B0H15DRAFT_936621 [Mycena belliae]